MSDATASFAALHATAQRDGAAVLVTVVQVRGSVPREAGTTMIVGHDTVDGTIGGGHLEFEAIRLSRAALAERSPPPPWVVRFPLAARLGQCCGGVVTLAFEAVERGSAWLAEAADAQARTEPFVRVACLGQTGALVVRRDAIAGSIGTPALDARAVELARDALSRAEDPTRIVELDSPAATLVLHAVREQPLHVLVFGNGHVGRALVTILAATGARVRWIDAREDGFPNEIPAHVEIVATDTPESEFTEAPRNACVLIATHDHALDFTLVCAALARDDWTYLGLIGSRSKRAQFERRLLARGFEADALARIVCPIGRSAAPVLDGKAPGIIALATATEIVAAHARAQGHRTQREEHEPRAITGGAP